jgi:hypothetical protein
MDAIRYASETARKANEFESICRRCGACCGSEDGDPCRNLVKDKNGRYECRIYQNRLGPQETVSGKIFKCVEIREMIARGCVRENCAYLIRD